MIQNYCWGENEKNSHLTIPGYTYIQYKYKCMYKGWGPFQSLAICWLRGPGWEVAVHGGAADRHTTVHCALHIVTLLLNVGAVAAEQCYMTQISLHYDRVPCYPHSFRAYT